MIRVHHKMPLLLLILMGMLSALLTACAKDSSVTLTATVSRDAKFGAAVLDLTAEDFENAGFVLGDGCDVVFENGYKLENIPYYNGYFVRTGDPLLVAYPGMKYVKAALNNRKLWTEAELEEGDTVVITRRSPGEYLDVQQVLGQSYSTLREEYDSDEQFVNFRALSGGNLRENYLYRGASPSDDSLNRTACADELLRKYGIESVINLADSEEEMAEDMEQKRGSESRILEIYEEGRVVTLDMSSAYDEEAYQLSLGRGMRFLLENEGPFYIHCTEGKDRTGFVCMLLEALSGADYEEMCADYMKTYENYYGITKEQNEDSYDAVAELYFDAFMRYLAGVTEEEKLDDLDYVRPARQYLAECGLTEEEIDRLAEKITK